MDKLTNMQMAEKLGLNLVEYRLGYHLDNNPNKLMPDGIKSITIHQTGNRSVGADALNHHNYLKNGSGGREVSWHYTVDEQEVIQSFRDNRVTYHSATSEGNNSSIGIEACVDADKVGEVLMGKTNYVKTLTNLQKLVAILMVQYDIPLTQIKQHHDWSGKHCPREIREGVYGITWSMFLAGVKEQHTALLKALKPAKTETKAPEGKLFRVALGAYGIRENAMTLIEEAKAKGFNAYLTIVDDPNYKK